MPKIGEGRNLFDDTPVNGEIEKGITSNWAYDEDVTLRALIEATLPWTIFINTYHTPKSQVNWNTFLYDSYTINNILTKTSGAQNDEITWDIVLGAGTWVVELIFQRETSRGIYSVQFDSVEKGTIDGYGGPSNNILLSTTGLVVPLTKKIELKLKMATKNPSSTGYEGAIAALRLIRTA